MSEVDKKLDVTQIVGRVKGVNVYLVVNSDIGNTIRSAWQTEDDAVLAAAGIEAGGRDAKVEKRAGFEVSVDQGNLAFNGIYLLADDAYVQFGDSEKLRSDAVKKFKQKLSPAEVIAAKLMAEQK